MAGSLDQKAILKQYFGHSAFRPGQEALIDMILSGRDCLGILPTGGGKSVCYQLPAVLLPGITLVISPLISLMKDQVGALNQSGIRAAYINSSLSAAQTREALRRAGLNTYKLIYVAPERLETPQFLNFARQADISLIAVDEAHCVSQWGPDFRPSYLNIPSFVRALPQRPVLCAFTATATPKVKEDIVHLLALKTPFLLAQGFDRPNLYFEVRRPRDKREELLRLLAERKDKSGIIYCSTRKNVDSVCDLLRLNGYAAARYHAGMSDAERLLAQDDFQFDRARIMVATNAFGMGIDKSNVSFVIHYNMPKDLESYYQEAGRAGRDGEKADCILLYGKQDVAMARYLLSRSAEQAGVDEEEKKKIQAHDLERLKQMTFYSTTKGCLRAFILRYFGETGMKNCGNCSSCLGARRLAKIQKAPPQQEELLFTALRLLRNQIAMEQKVPAYVIFSDATLRDMADKRPHSDEAFLQVSGVGQEKCRRYGAVFLHLISRADSMLLSGELSVAADASRLARDVYHATRPWTDAELVRFKAELAQGMSVYSLSKAHERPIEAIEAMLYKEGYRG